MLASCGIATTAGQQMRRGTSGVQTGCVLGEQSWILDSLVPSPTPSFSSLLSTVKRGGPGTFPHVSMT